MPKPLCVLPRLVAGLLTLSLVFPAYGQEQVVEVTPIKKIELAPQQCQVIFAIHNRTKTMFDLIQIDLVVAGKDSSLFGSPDVPPGGTGYMGTDVSGVSCADVTTFKVTRIPVSRCQLGDMSALACVEAIRITDGILKRR